MKRIIAFCIVITFLCHRHCGKWHDDAEKVWISNTQYKVSKFNISNFARLNCVMDPFQEKIIQNISYTQKYSTYSCGQYLFTRHILIGMQETLFQSNEERLQHWFRGFFNNPNDKYKQTPKISKVKCRFYEFSNYRNQSFILYVCCYK